MRKLLIHIGTPKTGTSSIQASLLAAQRQGTLRSVCYPDFSWAMKRKANPHAFLGYVYRSGKVPRVYRSKSKAQIETLDAYKSNFEDELLRWLKDHDNVILSSEYLASLSLAEALDFKKSLTKVPLDDMAVVVYVRNPADIYLSSAQQRLKASSVITDPRRYRYRFKKIITTWSEVFDGRIIVRPFDRTLLHQNCAVQDFVRTASQFFGRELGAIETIEANVSLSAEAIVVLQKYRAAFHGGADGVFKEDSSRLVRLLTTSQETIRQTRPRIRKEIRHLINKRHEKPLNWLRSSYGIDFSSDGHEPVSDWRPGSAKLQVEDILEFDEEIVEQLLFYALGATLKAAKNQRDARAARSPERSGR